MGCGVSKYSSLGDSSLWKSQPKIPKSLTTGQKKELRRTVNIIKKERQQYVLTERTIKSMLQEPGINKVYGAGFDFKETDLKQNHIYKRSIKHINTTIFRAVELLIQGEDISFLKDTGKYHTKNVSYFDPLFLNTFRNVWQEVLEDYFGDAYSDTVRDAWEVSMYIIVEEMFSGMPKKAFELDYHNYHKKQKKHSLFKPDIDGSFVNRSRVDLSEHNNWNKLAGLLPKIIRSGPSNSNSFASREVLFTNNHSRSLNRLGTAKVNEKSLKNESTASGTKIGMIQKSLLTDYHEMYDSIDYGSDASDENCTTINGLSPANIYDVYTMPSQKISTSGQGWFQRRYTNIP